MKTRSAGADSLQLRTLSRFRALGVAVDSSGNIYRSAERFARSIFASIRSAQGWNELEGYAAHARGSDWNRGEGNKLHGAGVRLTHGAVGFRGWEIEPGFGAEIEDTRMGHGGAVV